MNVEADSINAALLAPDSTPGSAAFDAFLREAVREMTVKAGQKCTAIRRIFVPSAMAGAVAEALAARLKSTRVGDPRREETRMGPVVTRAQQAAAFDGIRRLAAEAEGGLRRRRCAGARRYRPRQVGVRGADLARARGRELRRGGARGRGLRSGRDRRALSRPGRCIRAHRAWRRVAGGLGLRRGQGVADAHRKRDRPRPWPYPRRRSRDRDRPYRPRHRHAAMQPWRPRPSGRGRGAGRAAWLALLSSTAGGAGIERSARRLQPRRQACSDGAGRRREPNDTDIRRGEGIQCRHRRKERRAASSSARGCGTTNSSRRRPMPTNGSRSTGSRSSACRFPISMASCAARR